MKLILENKNGWTKEYCLLDHKTKTDYILTCRNCESKISIDNSSATQFENLKLKINADELSEFGGTGYINKLVQCENCTSIYLIGIGYTEPNYGRDVWFLHNIIELDKVELKKQKLDNLGNIVIQKLRDENFEYYLSLKEFSKSMLKSEYYSKPRNPNYDAELQKLDDERFEFLNNLTETQLENLDKLILGIIDFTSFNFLREVEEKQRRNQSIGLTIDGIKAENISFELLSGTFFGEYLTWCEEKSKFGKYQN